MSRYFLSLNFQTRHESVKFEFNGNKPPIDEICGLSVLNVEPPDLFCNLSRDCKPITTKSRKYNSGDKKFIKDEVQCLLSEGIIEPSTPPWRGWAVVTKDDHHKKRLVIDYSQAIKQLDAYRYQIRMIKNKMAQLKVFTSVDLKSAYHRTISSVYPYVTWCNQWS